MGIYYTLGKGLLGLFVGFTSLLSPAPLPKPDAVVLTAQEISPIISTSTAKALIPLNESATNTNSSIVATTTKPKYISIYLNYPEKIVVSPAKTLDQNFKQIFEYSIQPTSSLPTSETQIGNKQTTSPVQPITVVSTESSNNSAANVPDSVVNIYCTIKIGNAIKAVTGSGVIIDPRGVVLTNAHVGEFPLLQGSSIAKNMTCSVRTGSPTSVSYGVKTLYISKDWINNNYKNISQTNFSETGEGDIAVLQIVDKQTGIAPAKSFSYLSLSTNAPSINDSVSIASYPADSLATLGVSAPLSIQDEQLRISDAFSFSNSPLADLIETSDSLYAGHGSSGGALADSSGKLAGIIVITVNGNNAGAKHVRALTIRHIDATLQKDTGLSLSAFLSQDLTSISSQFEATRQTLVQKLTDGSALLFF